MRWPVALTIVVAALLAASRGLPFVLWPHSAFDADQAIVGLMAKHLAEARAFPMFYYGQPYMLAVQAWLAAPLFAIAGPSIALLKMPLLAINGAAAGLLVWLLMRETSLRPLQALAAAGVFVLAAPAVGAQLVAAMGGSVEPFLYALVIWLLRARWVACGFVAALGFLHREFSIYALGALVLIDATYAPREWRRHAVKWAVIGAAFLSCIQVVRVLRPYGDTFGPDLPQLQMPARAPTFYAITTRLACAAPAEFMGNVAWLFNDNLPTLIGATGRLRNLYYAGAATDPRPWLLAAFVAVLLGTVMRTAWIGIRTRRAPPPFVTFLFTIAVQACLFYVGSCDVQGPMLTRYTLLALLAPIAAAAAYLHAETNASLRRLLTLLLLALMAAHAYSYVGLVREYMAEAPQAPQAIVAEWLEQRGIRYARADYWDGYYITFVSDERVIVASVPQRILIYESLVSHAPEVMFVQRTPCPAAEVVGRYWLCRDDTTAQPRAADGAFPSQHDILQFRDALERKYRDGLGRAPAGEATDVRAETLWTYHYLRHRLSGCDPRAAEQRVVGEFEGRQHEPCGSLAPGAIPRDELLQSRTRLESQLPHDAAAVLQQTSVDVEGQVVWAQEYVVARMSGCDHAAAVNRVFQMIDGRAPGGGCR